MESMGTGQGVQEGIMGKEAIEPDGKPPGKGYE